MKALKIAIVLILLINGFFSLMSWLSPDPEPVGDYFEPRASQISQPPAQAAEGFDLAALTVLTKEIRSGQELERRLNTKGGINNLDLDDDGKVDYLQVEEFGQPESGKIGYSVFTEPEINQRQEVAEVTVEQNKDNAEIQVIGNPEIYGDDQVFNDFAPIKREGTPPAAQGAAPYPVYSSYFMPRPLWMSPYGYGMHPPYFSVFPLIMTSMYLNRMGGYHSMARSGPSAHQQTSNRQLNNPNKGKSASSGIKRSLRKPTSTQKQFAAKSNSQKVGKGGFGQNKSASRSSASSSRGSSTGKSSFGQRQGRGFGSSASTGQVRSSRGFGSSSPRSSRSFRGSSGSSRSFSFGGK